MRLNNSLIHVHSKLIGYALKYVSSIIYYGMPNSIVRNQPTGNLVHVLHIKLNYLLWYAEYNMPIYW